ANSMLTTVATEMGALRSTWRRVRSPSGTPVARAVRMYSADKTSRAAERTMRVEDAARASPRAWAGKVRDMKALPGLWDHGVKPPAGSQRKFTANTRMRKIPSQKDGVAMPIWAKA